MKVWIDQDRCTGDCLRLSSVRWRRSTGPSHIPKLIDYWCWILFGTSGYGGAVTKTHGHLHSLEPLLPEHCDRWYRLWTASIDGAWSGPTADRAKSHPASLMAGLAKHVFGFVWTPPTLGLPGRDHDAVPRETRHRRRQ